MGNDSLAAAGGARPSRTAGARRGLVALVATILGIALVGLVLGLSYYREVVAPAREWIVRIDGQTVMTTGELARAIVVRDLISGNPSPEAELGRAPFVMSDARVDLELMRAAAPAMGLTVTDGDLDAKLRERFQPGASGDTAVTGEVDRLFREAYIRFLTERGIDDDEYQQFVEADILRERFIEMLGGSAELEDWLAEQRNERAVDVRVGSEEYAWVLDEVRASRPVTGRE